MQAFVVGNITMDETIGVAEMPTRGASILGRPLSRDLGGKGANQAIVMARCGLPTRLIAAVGDDSRGAGIRRRLEDEPLDPRLTSLSDGISDYSLVFTTPDGENAIITTSESAQNLPLSETLDQLGAAAAGDLVALQGNLTDATTRAILEYARTKGLVTALNPSPIRPFFAELWPLIDIAFLNTGEAEILTGASGEPALRQLLSAGVKQAVLTRGAEGAMFASPDGLVTIPAEPCPVIDTTGAGDTFMAVALASSGLRGTALDRRAVEHATRAAAITVRRRGTLSAFPSAAELADILRAA